MLLELVGISSLIWSDLTRDVRYVLLVDRKDTGTTKAKIVLQGDASALDLALHCHASELPAKLRALGQASSPKRVTLRDETTARIDDTLTTKGEIISINGFAGLTLLAESQCLVSNQLICAEAIVEFDHIDLIRCDTSHLVGFISGRFRHRSTNQINRRTAKGVRTVCRQADTRDFDGLVLEAVSTYKVFRANDCSSGTICIWTTSEQLYG